MWHIAKVLPIPAGVVVDASPRTATIDFFWVHVPRLLKG